MFEYKVMGATMTEAQLNELGTDGWELVCCVPFSGGFQLYFKRRVNWKS